MSVCLLKGHVSNLALHFLKTVGQARDRLKNNGQNKNSRGRVILIFSPYSVGKDQKT